MSMVSDKFIEEQNKYMDYYKLRKTHDKKHQNELLDFLNKKGSEISKIELMNMPLLTKRLNNINDNVNSLLNQLYVKNSVNADLSNLNN
jgi:hypothetical protein